MICLPQVTAGLTKRHRVKMRYGGGRLVLIKDLMMGAEDRPSEINQFQLVDDLRNAARMAQSPVFRIAESVEMSTAEAAFSRREGGGDA